MDGLTKVIKYFQSGKSVKIDSKGKGFGDVTKRRRTRSS
jgi:hypothetical protein